VQVLVVVITPADRGDVVDLDAEEVELSGLRLPRKLGCYRRGDLVVQARIDLELGAAAEHELAVGRAVPACDDVVDENTWVAGEILRLQ
jgi:hypothetical protein